MANFTGHLLEVQPGWDYFWGKYWGDNYLSAIVPYQANRNDRIHTQPSWDFWWNQNWGGNVNLFDGWNVNWDYVWGGNFPGGHFRSKHEAYYIDNIGGGGAYTNNRPIALRGFNHTGFHGGGFIDVFYNRILIEPTLLDFGTILSEQTLEFLVFNAYLVTKQLDDIDENDFDSGMQFSGETLPKVYDPLEEITYNVTVTTQGDPSIDASLVFDWEIPIDDISVSIIGSRIVLLPVNFRTRVREALVWKTDVMEAYDGTEQRVRVRLSPRQQLSIKAYLDRYQMHRVENLIYGWRKREWAMPMWIEARQVDSSVTQDDTVIQVNTGYGDFRVDRLAVIWENENKFDVFQIAAITATTITSNRGINDNYSIDSKIMPVRSCRMLRDPVRRASGYDAILETAMEITDNITLTTSPSAIQWNGEDTFFMEPLATSDDGVDDKYQHRIDVMDFGTGVVDWNAPWNNIRINREFELILEGLQEIWEYREWLHRRAGRLRPFYMPTFENHFKILTQGNISDSFRAVANDYSRQSTGRVTICFKMTDGTYEIRTITGAEINAFGELEVTFTPNLDEDASEVDEVNFFGLKRLGNDRIEIEWQANNVAVTLVPITEISP